MKNSTMEMAAKLFTTLILALIIGLGIIFCFTGCYTDPQSTKIEGNGVKVEFLFEHNGIRMYRFIDGGRMHYFTDRGETITTQSGKNNCEERIN